LTNQYEFKQIEQLTLTNQYGFKQIEQLILTNQYGFKQIEQLILTNQYGFKQTGERNEKTQTIINVVNCCTVLHFMPSTVGHVDCPHGRVLD
jgi:uncharacterized protein YfbU (UPF0304 family)